MATNLEKLEKQIARLQKEAEALRAKEVSEVVGRIKEAIAHYKLTPAELFGAAAKPAGKKTRAARKGAPAKKPASVVKFRDEAGHVWSGRGKRPNWFKEALAAGKTADDLLVK